MIVSGLIVMAIGGIRECSQAKAHDIYGSWHVPGNPKSSCCNDSDCRPTRAYVDEEGRWRAWDGFMWLVVPPERVLPTDYAHDGRSHLCAKSGFVYCFSPTGPRI